MTLLLFWLALPLLASAWMPRRRTGAAAVQLIFAGAALAALHQGAATLDPGELHMIAGQSVNDAWFVGVSAGVILVGVGLLPALASPWLLVLALPLIGGTLLAVTGTMAAPIAVGGIAALLPAGLAKLGPAPLLRDEDDERHAVRRALWWLALATVAAIFVAPAPVALLLLALLLWSRSGAPRAVSIAAGVACTALLAAWGVLAEIIAGSPWITLGTLARTAPISPAASQLLASLSIPALVLAVWPWHRSSLARSTLWVAAALAFHLMIGTATPDGASHWQPIVTTAGVLVLLVAAWRRAATTVFAVAIVLTASRAGDLALGAALLAALAPAVFRIVGARLREAYAGVVLALVIATVLQDQVLAGVVLTLGAATAGHRTARRVAPIPLPDHF